ncbi:MAG: methylmalonyl Co-A mutase-associated GTPase MeaB [Chloroflexi bacterium CG_4_10_14_0_8_um_filter_46_9]|nr:MAG: GTPase [Dehalococcoidia bacterium CG2_30_46_19]PIW40103.1 MAG: methylmalonyl Co-A mutase-associated GTPase MeaB [Chloroflexi bacterium CG15_BIG_FIL_POST_REV_8_21_14_020_46_15]PIZ26829.1 MAG: methylmalonyl Co-A mutase-associated GTPase MeaB [Chloroflexi bacterium CG_4_10_14_0_8_um_filter_46_9]
MRLAKEVLQGNIKATARLIRDVEDELPSAIEELKALYPYTGRSYIIGITGSPGSGKSTLIDMLIDVFRKRGKTIGVIAIDPSSPFSGGAILGDRIRMQRHATDGGVFIRSLATRGWRGGLSRATANIINIMDAMGKDIILIETVGAGQAEVDIINFTHTTMVMLVPGMGDWVQTLKAGILEIADIFVINKADKKGADELKAELEAMLQMSAYSPQAWKPKIFLTEAVNNKGIDELVEGIYQHKEFLIATGGHDTHLKERARLELIEVLKSSLMDHVFQIVNKNNYLEKLIDDLVNKRTDPYSAASDIIKKLAQEGKL